MIFRSYSNTSKYVLRDYVIIAMRIFSLLKIYILLDVLGCSIAVYFYELCRIMTRPTGSSKYNQRVQIFNK